MGNHECKKCLGADRSSLGQVFETSLYLLTKSLQRFDFNFSTVSFFSFVNFLRRVGGRSQKN